MTCLYIIIHTHILCTIIPTVSTIEKQLPAQWMYVYRTCTYQLYPFSQNATICSENFPLVSYIVNVANGNETDSMTYLVANPLIADQTSITLPVPSAGLRQDEDYQVTVTACITVICRTTLTSVFFSEYN